MEIPMILTICCDCSIAFALPAEYNEALKQSHKTFYCPKGHGQYYKDKSDVERAREERNAARNLLNSARAELRELKKKKNLTKKSAL